MIIASSKQCLDTAWALHYLSGYAVSLFEQFENSEHFYSHQLDKLEKASRYNQLKSYRVLCDDPKSIGLCVNSEVFKPRDISGDRNIISVVCQRVDQLQVEQLDLLSAGLTKLKEALPDLEINLIELYSTKTKTNRLTEVVTTRYCNIGAVALNELYAKSALVIDADAIIAPTLASYEAVASGTVAVILAKEDSKVFISAQDASELVDYCREIIGDKILRATTIKEGLGLVKDQNKAYLEKKLLDQIYLIPLNKNHQARPLSIVIPVTDEFETLALSLRVLELSCSEIKEIIIVDNDAPKAIKSWLKNVTAKFKLQVITLSSRTTITKASTEGLKAVAAECNVVLMRPNHVVSLTALRALLTAHEKTGAKIITPVIVNNTSSLSLNAQDDFLLAAKRFQDSSLRSYPQDFSAESSLVFIAHIALETCKANFSDYESWNYAIKDLSIKMTLMGRAPVVADDALVIGVGSQDDSFIPAGDVGLYQRRWEHFCRSLSEQTPKNAVLKSNAESYKQLEPKYEIAKAYFEPKEIDPDFGLIARKPTNRRSANVLLNDIEVVFLLPSVVLGGGSLSVLQHVDELNLRGIKAKVFTTAPLEVKSRPYLAPAVALSSEELLSLKWTNQIVIATFWTTAYLLRAICHQAPKVRPYYYIQDYEPWFYSHPDEFSLVQKVEKTYEFGFQGVAKTQFLADVVKEHHGIDIEVITPGIDPFVFYPGEQDQFNGRPRLAAMYRPETPRRGGAELIQMLRILKDRLPELEVNVFGQNAEVPEGLEGYMNVLGKLSPARVADLYRNSDIIVDLSFWHGFGRMGLEGMSAGAVPVLSKSGGVNRYAKDGENAFLVDLDYPDDAAERVITLAKDQNLRLAMRQNGQNTSVGFTEQQAAEDWIRILGV